MPIPAYLIDSVDREVRLIQVDGLGTIGRHLACRMFTAPWQTPNGDTLFVDDEGLIRRSRFRTFFQIHDRPQAYPPRPRSNWQPLPGLGLIMSAAACDGDDESPPLTSIEDFRLMVAFLTEERAMELYHQRETR